MITLSLSEKVTSVLNGTIESVKGVIPLTLDVEKPTIMSQPLEQTEIGVLIGMTGDVRGRIVIESTESTFGAIGEVMFGMALEGEMLQSFTGELGNMIAGNLSTKISEQGINMDITPPTVMVGNSKLYGFERAFRVPIIIEDKGQVQIILMVEEK